MGELVGGVPDQHQLGEYHMPIYLKTSQNQSNTVPGPVNGMALAAIAALVLAGVMGFHSTAIAQSLGPPVQVTGSDPFSDCTADNLNSQKAAYGSTLYPNTSIEPWVAADPTDPSRLLVGHQQDRWSDGGARGLVGVVSSD